MERTEMLKKHGILSQLSSLPKKVLSLHGRQHVSDFVLHELCNSHCFDLKKAAYLVDNPDFDCLKGVAGFYDAEAYPVDTMWQNPDLFVSHVEKAPFNTKVRSILKPSRIRSHTSEQETTQMIGDYLGIIKPGFCSWSMKHDNQGILIYETEPNSCPVSSEILVNGACLLGFCPIY